MSHDAKHIFNILLTAIEDRSVTPSIYPAGHILEILRTNDLASLDIKNQVIQAFVEARVFAERKDPLPVLVDILSNLENVAVPHYTWTYVNDPWQNRADFVATVFYVAMALRYSRRQATLDIELLIVDVLIKLSDCESESLIKDLMNVSMHLGYGTLDVIYTKAANPFYTVVVSQLS